MSLAWTVDVGNTRTKLAAWRVAATLADGTRPEFVERPLGTDASADDARLAALAERHGRPGRIVVSSVAPERLARIEAALAAHGEPVVNPPCGLRNATRRPAEVGPDRLFAARGAGQLVGAPAIVVDVGTAVTVDAVGLDETGPAFLGGAIAPGARVAARALGEAGARLFDVEPTPGAPALGRTSRDALIAGLVHGQRGTVRELASALAAEAGLGAAPLVVTGGARALLGAPWCPERWVDEPELVALGLLAAALDVPLPPRGPRWSAR